MVAARIQGPELSGHGAAVVALDWITPSSHGWFIKFVELESTSSAGHNIWIFRLFSCVFSSCPFVDRLFAETGLREITLSSTIIHESTRTENKRKYTNSAGHPNEPDEKTDKQKRDDSQDRPKQATGNRCRVSGFGGWVGRAGFF